MSATRPQRTALRRAGTINQMLQLRSETSQAQSLRDSCTRPERACLSASSSSYTAAGVHPAESVRSLGVKSLMPCSLSKLRRLLLLSGVSLNFLQVCSSWPSLKNTTSTCAGRPGVLCRAPSQHHQRRPVTESFSLPINPPEAAGSVLVSFHVTAADLCLPRCGVGC